MLEILFKHLCIFVILHNSKFESLLTNTYINTYNALRSSYNVNLILKSPEHGLGINMGKI